MEEIKNIVTAILIIIGVLLFLIAFCILVLADKKADLEKMEADIDLLRRKSMESLGWYIRLETEIAEYIRNQNKKGLARYSNEDLMNELARRNQVKPERTGTKCQK